METSCIALVGGKGSRLGRNKVLEVIGNKNLLLRVISCLASFQGEIIVVKAENQVLPPLVDYPKVKIVRDIYPRKGPLGGIYTGLTESGSFYNVIVAGDMPFLNHSLLSHMLELSIGFDVVVPRIGEMVEPLHAVYSKSCLPAIESLLEHGDLQVSHLLEMLKVRYVEAREIDRYDAEHLSFFNINTEADLKRARDLAREGHDKC